ncbi:MAG: virulence RhuM family protein [Ectothiorhodospiraceae bacterium]|nr:virulence RhuM family protein [Ectothiorhodospiraceae bacterium]
MKNTIQIYENEGHQVEVRLDGERDTVWLIQAQMVDFFERNQSVISRHVRNVFKEEELEEESNMQKTHIAYSDKPVAFYSLDVIISVGYRVKSPQGVRFRQWATQRLKEYLIQGYTLNQQRFDNNAEELQQAIALIQKTAKSPVMAAEAGSGLEKLGKAKWTAKLTAAIECPHVDAL